MGSLKSFIKSVRSAKTLKDERNVIQKESAKIRSAFREQKASQRSRRENVAKLLYLFTLGERTHFGQVECVKLLASPKFTDKRLGYLGTMLLLDENQEVLTLVTNSIDNDLSHPNQYVMSLALTTLANIASDMMARDLFQRVETLIGSSNPYIKKKAAICALRIIRRVPDYEDIFVEHAKALLTESNHGVLMCGAALATDMIDNNPDLVPQFSSVIPNVLTSLKQLSSSGFSPEFDVGGVPDPFLQCALIRLLRAFGQDNEELSEMMSDLLAAIATNTDNSRNVGNAVLYETVLTIFGIETGPPQSDSGLRVLGINILAKFLTTKNINTRYSALNTLLRVVEIEPAAVQRHRQVIMDCIRDPDVSIRRRALELSYVLINSSNVRLMVRELLSVLETCDTEFKPQLVFQIALNAERFAPNVKWHIDTLIRMFVHAGNFTKENVLSAFILLVINAPELQLYATQRVYAALKNDFSQEGLTVVALWLLGEYGDVLVKGGTFTAYAESSESDKQEQVEATSSGILDTIVNILESPYATITVQEYAINALIKLTSRLKNGADIERIRRLIENKENSFDSEIQQRAVEYTALIGEGGALRKGILARMPAPQFGEDLEAQHAKAMSKALIKKRRRPAATNTSSTAAASGAAGKAGASDLLDFGGDDITSPGGPAGGVNSANAASDLLSDIFGSSGAPPTKQSSSATNDIVSLFNKPNASENAPASIAPSSTDTNNKSPLDDLASSIAVPQSRPQTHEAFTNEDITVSFSASNEKPGQALVIAYYDGKKQISELNMQVALPKTQQLSLQSLSRADINPTTSASQNMRVAGPQGASVKLRLRLTYTVNGEKKIQQFDFSKLPKNLL